MMFRQHFWHGNGIVRGTAMSGIDIALWDILGKVHGVPCHKLWGGPVRDYVRLYGHLGGGKMEDFYESDEPQRFGELAAGMVEEGFTAFKSMAVPPTMPLEGLAPIRHAEALRRRDARGGRRGASTSWSTATPARARAWATSSPRRSSRSASTGSRSRAGRSAPDDIAAIQRSVKTPIATGERLVGAQAVRRAARRKGACSVIQPDITHCGGLTEVRRIAALAEVHRVALAPHNPQGPVSTAASIELGLATPSYIICEAVTSDVPWRDEVATESHPIDPVGMLARRDRAARARDRDRPRRRREAPVRAGAAAAGLLRRRQRRRLVAVADGRSTARPCAREHRYEHLTWPEINEAVRAGEGRRAAGRARSSSTAITCRSTST